MVDIATVPYVDSQDATKAALVHTHTASQISDSTTTGRSLIVASDAATARTAIGAAQDITRFRASLRQTTNQPSLASGWQSLTFDVADINVGSGWTSSVKNRWTVPVGGSGDYLIEGKVQTGGNYELNVRIIKNGAQLPDGTGTGSAGGTDGKLSSASTGMKLLSLVAGDYIEVQGYRPVAWATAVYGDGTSSLNVVRIV